MAVALADIPLVLTLRRVSDDVRTSSGSLIAVGAVVTCLVTCPFATAGGVCGAGKLVAANRYIKVVKTTQDSFAPTLYACGRRSHRRLRMGQRFADLDSEYTDHIRLTGRYLAFQNAMVGKDSGAIYDVYVWNSQTGKRRSYPTGRLTSEQRDDAPSGAEGVGPVTDLVLSYTGHVAWIAEDTYTHSYEVWALRDRRPALLDADPAIVHDSLRLKKRGVTWLHGGETRVAFLG